MQNVDCLLHVASMQTSGNDQLADAVDHAGPRLHALPIESPPGTAPMLGVGRVQQHARDYTWAKSVRFQKKVAVVGHVDLLHSFSFVGFIWLDETAGYRVPANALVGGLVEDMCRARAEDDRPPQAFRHQTEKRAGKFGILLAVKLNRGEARLGDDPLYAFHRLVHEHADLFHLEG